VWSWVGGGRLGVMYCTYLYVIVLSFFASQAPLSARVADVVAGGTLGAVALELD
jgi:hypothetical protein